MFAVVAFTAVALVGVVAKVILLPLRLMLLPFKLLAAAVHRHRVDREIRLSDRHRLDRRGAADSAGHPGPLVGAPIAIVASLT